MKSKKKLDCIDVLLCLAIYDFVKSLVIAIIRSI